VVLAAHQERHSPVRGDEARLEVFALDVVFVEHPRHVAELRDGTARVAMLDHGDVEALACMALAEGLRQGPGHPAHPLRRRERRSREHRALEVQRPVQPELGRAAALRELVAPRIREELDRSELRQGLRQPVNADPATAMRRRRNVRGEEGDAQGC
jgi:hypothetical protein